MKRFASGDVVQWRVDCADVFGRNRTMWIGLTPTSILMAVPPGEVAVLSAEQASELRRCSRSRWRRGISWTWPQRGVAVNGRCDRPAGAVNATAPGSAPVGFPCGGWCVVSDRCDDADDAVAGQPDPHDPPWRMSVLDGRVHAWVSRDFVTQAWIARCGHTAEESQTAPDGGEPRCVDCVTGELPRLSERFGGLSERIHAQTVRDLAAEAETGDTTEPDTGTADSEHTGGPGDLAGFLREIEQRYAAGREL